MVSLRSANEEWLGRLWFGSELINWIIYETKDCQQNGDDGQDKKDFQLLETSASVVFWYPNAKLIAEWNWYWTTS